MFMGYYNPILSYGLERFAQDASDAGLDGVIVPDLPYEEAETLRTACGRKGIHLIPLLAPTSTDERIAKTCEKAEAFVYCVSVTGVTGRPAGAAERHPGPDSEGEEAHQSAHCNWLWNIPEQARAGAGSLG